MRFLTPVQRQCLDLVAEAFQKMDDDRLRALFAVLRAHGPGGYSEGFRYMCLRILEVDADLKREEAAATTMQARALSGGVVS